MFSKMIKEFTQRVNEIIEERLKEMLNIYDGFDTLFTPKEIKEFLGKNKLEIRSDIECNEYPIQIIRYYIYDSNLATDTVCFYYKMHREELTVDISQIYVWPGWENKYDQNIK